MGTCNEGSVCAWLKYTHITIGGNIVLFMTIMPSLLIMLLMPSLAILILFSLSVRERGDMI